MRQQIEKTVSELQSSWKNLSIESIDKIKLAIKTLATDPAFQNQLQLKSQELARGLELYRDQTSGFVLLAYSEVNGKYRAPHDHGNAWVVYAVATGQVEMGNYFKSILPNGHLKLVLKNRENLESGDIRIYYPGEIHDTRSLSDNAVIIRLTSLDLREEERAGRMNRYQD